MSEPLAAWGGRAARCPPLGSRVCETFQQPSFPRRRESTGGGRRWVPVCTGTTGGGGRTHNRPSRARRESTGGGPAMGSRLHGNDGRRRAHPQSSFPRRRESAVGGRRWVPVCTGTTGGGGRTHNRHSRDGGNPRWGAGDGFPSARERRAAVGAPTIVIPATAGIRGGGRRWVPVCTGTTGGGGRTHNRHSRDGGNPRWGPAMGSRLHGNDGRRRAYPQSSFPRRRESTGGAGDGFPSARERRAAAGAPTIVIRATAGIRGGGPAMGSRLHGNDGRRRRSHNRHSVSGVTRDGGNPRVGAGDGFPSARERRAAAGAPTIVIPATAGIHGGGPAMGSRLHGNDAAAAEPHRHSSEWSYASDGGNPRWGPAMGSRLHGNDGRRRAHPHRHSRDGGNPWWGPAMGSRLHGNDGRRRAHPQSSFPRRRESTAGGRRWVPVCTGTTGGGGRTHNRHSRDGGNPRRGAGDGFPSARERRAAAGAPTIVIPATAGIRGGGRRWVPVCTGTTGGDRRTHNRHSREGGNPGLGVPR